jgi:hypothetical protein
VARPKSASAKNTTRSVRVRSRPLDQIDEAKLATAIALLARRMLEQRARVRAAADPDSVERGAM